MRYTFIILLCFIFGRVSSQSIILENNEIILQLIKTSSDTVTLILKNKTNITVFIDLEDVNSAYLENYVGIGLYSSVFPYLPNHMKKYENVRLKSLNNSDSLVFKRSIKFKKGEGLKVNIDYIINKNEEIIKNEISRSLYDKNVNFLKLNLSQFNY